MTAMAPQGTAAPTMPLGYGSAMGEEPPTRGIQWSLVFLGASCIVMVLGLGLAISGVPGKLAYDADAPGERNTIISNDPMKTMQSIDANLKWVRDNTGYEADQFNGLLDAINTSEEQIGLMAASVMTMTASVKQIDDELKAVAVTTAAMNQDMQEMSETATASAATMSQLDADIQAMSGSLSSLATATEQLTTAMASIEAKAGTIASKRTNVALENTRQLNTLLPTGVPTPTTSLDPGYAQGAQ